MGIIESTARITRKYLLNKTKNELVDLYFDLLRQNDKLEADVKRLRLAAGPPPNRPTRSKPSPVKSKG